MKKLLPLITILIFACSTERIEPDPYKECRDFFTGELIAEAELIEGDIIPDKKTKAVAIKDRDRLWPDKTIPYYYQKRSKDENNIITMGFREADIDTLQDWIKEVATRTGFKFIRFENRQHLKEHYNDGVVIEPGFMASSSHVGRQGGIQSFRIAYTWEDIPHEAGHLFGLLHGQNSLNRDEHIDIDFDNIRPKHHDQFDIYKYQSIDCGAFDFESVMLYPSIMESIAVDPYTPVMTKKNGETWERNIWFSENDLKAIEVMYNSK